MHGGKVRIDGAHQVQEEGVDLVAVGSGKHALVAGLKLQHSGVPEAVTGGHLCLSDKR